MHSDRRQMLNGLLALGCCFGFSLPHSRITGIISAANAKTAIDPQSGICSPVDWDEVFINRWGMLGRQSRDQINYTIHAKNGVYDDSDGVFAWIVHYWLRAWAKMADLTGEEKYLHAGMSFIDYMFKHTDEARIRRGEIVENYLRDPASLQGKGRGGPFWKRWEEANVLNTGQIAHGILRFVDTVFENRDRWPAYALIAEGYFEQTKRAVDAFDPDWRNFGNAGSYFYRDSEGSNVLGPTQTAFNQSATMCSAHLLLDKWENNASRRDKATRLVRSWLNDFAEFHDNGTVTWPYILVEHLRQIEDTDHATVDLDFLTLSHGREINGLKKEHLLALAKTFKKNIWRTDGTLNRNIDGSTTAGFDQHYCGGYGWFELSRYDPEVLEMVRKTYEKHYRANSDGGVLWARPMLGWANILATSGHC